MRNFIVSATAVVVSSAVAFFAGAHSRTGGSVARACVTTAPAITASQAAVGAMPVGAIDPAAEPDADPEPEVLGDVDRWPYTSWPLDQAAGARLWSKVRFLWVRPEPKRSNKWFGYLSLGDSVRLRGGDKEAAYVGKSDSVHCDSWYAVEPRGYVCTSDERVSFDGDTPIMQALTSRRADASSAWPYHYAESTSTPVYQTIPPKHKQRRRESRLEEHLAKVRRGRQAKTDADKIAIDPGFAGVDLQLTGKQAPRLLDLGPRGRTNKTKVVRGSTLAFTDEFDADGRSWLMTWDRGIVPRDRVKVYDRSPFHGVAVNDEIQLPIAFFRREQPKYRRTDDGQVVVTDESWPRHGHVMVTEEQIDVGGKRYVVTKEDGLLVSVDGISVARRSYAIPPRIESMNEGRRTWVDISILKGWLVAYEYDKPVYATLVSPGRGGVPKHGVDPLETASTPVGRYRITGKFLTATMISNASKDIVHDEVMYTQNFTGPYALHGAYWHDEWGEKKSGGCVNLSPIDARRLFMWTEPRLPAGWHSIQLVTGYPNALAEYQRATLVYVHK